MAKPFPTRFAIAPIVGAMPARRWLAGRCTRWLQSKVTKGTPKVYESSAHGRRHFCPDCGMGVFYTNAEVLPGIIDIQSATYDDPGDVPARVHIQIAERISWMERAM